MAQQRGELTSAWENNKNKHLADIEEIINAQTWSFLQVSISAGRRPGVGCQLRISAPRHPFTPRDYRLMALAQLHNSGNLIIISSCQCARRPEQDPLQLNFWFVKLRLRSIWLCVALSGSHTLRLSQALSGFLLCDCDFDFKPGAHAKLGLPPPTTH